MPAGSDPAYRYAIAGTAARAFSTRAGYYLRNVIPVWINGAARSGVVLASIRVDLNTGDEPHRCTFVLKGGSGFVPAAGQPVVIGGGTTANPLFAGRLLRVTRRAKRADDRRADYQCDAAGHVFELNTARVAPGFSARSMAPYSIVSGLLAVTTPNVLGLGFSTEFVSTAIPAVEEFTVTPGEEIAGALDRMFRSVDATWYVDHDKRIRAYYDTDPGPGSIPNTLTVGSSLTFWDLDITPTNLSRVFTRAHVIGAGVPTLADVDPSRHLTLPLETASLIANQAGGSGDDNFMASAEAYLVGGVEVSPLALIYTKGSQFNAGQASVFLPASRGTNTLTVVAANVASVSPIDVDRWYQVSGQYLYVSSRVGVFSATASSIAYNYWIHPSGAGAITSDISPFADIAAPFNFAPSNTSFGTRTFPAGTQIETYATRVNTPARDAVASLFGSNSYGLISKTFRDGRLAPDGAADVALDALERGAPSQWLAVDFATRDEAFNIGRPVYVSVTSTAEPSGTSIAGTFIAHDVTIDGFGALTETKGPTRTVSAAAARKPTLWQILQGER